MSSSTNSPCAACKCLRRKCTQECVFAPYFPPDNPRRFTSVHRVFGASNVAKLLNELNAAQRDDAVKSLAYEAEARLRDPVYGCVGLISFLHGRLRDIQLQLNDAKKELATYIGPQAFQANMNMNMSMNMNMPPTGILTHGVIPQSHNNPYGGFPFNGLPPAVLGGGGGGGGQLVIRDGSQQHQILEAQQMAVAVKEQQDMIREYEQQYQQNNNNNISSSSSNQEFVRFGGGGGGGFDLGSVSGSGFNDNNSLHIGGGGGGVVSAEMAPSLALGGGLFDGGAIQVAAEGEHGHQQQQIQAAQLMLSPQQQQQRQQQGHQQAESEEVITLSDAK